MNSNHKFSSDFRESNPKLHRLYVEFAMADFREIDRALKRFGNLCHADMSAASY